MMKYTNAHLRRFLRMTSKRTKLYTEMHTVQALRHQEMSEIRRVLGCRDRNTDNVALQIGGSEVDDVDAALRRVWGGGYAFQARFVSAVVLLARHLSECCCAQDGERAVTLLVAVHVLVCCWRVCGKNFYCATPTHRLTRSIYHPST